MVNKVNKTFKGEFCTALLLFVWFAKLSLCESKTAWRTSLPVYVAGKKISTSQISGRKERH